MDLRVYFQKIKQLEEIITGAFAVVVSHETPDGGIAGVLTEAPKSVAAQLVVEGKARLASQEEADARLKQYGPNAIQAAASKKRYRRAPLPANGRHSRSRA